MKIVSKDSIKDVSDIERIYRETFILTNLRHPNIIRLYEVRERLRKLLFDSAFCMEVISREGQPHHLHF